MTLPSSTLEKALFDLLTADTETASARPVFILGAPRTGSTVFYQAVCSQLTLPYIANLANDFFATAPIVGLAIQKGLPVEIAFESRYGKTKGLLQPSEGSAVMTHWFGGGHPSALVSARILDGMEPHFLATLAAVEALFGAPLVIKNAWNCFRIAAIAKAIPHARFLWIRRDIVASAKSDLAARYVTQGSPYGWNSATPANLEELQKLPPPAQVLENQYAFNQAISTALTGHATGRWLEVWYEDFRQEPNNILNKIGNFLGLKSDNPNYSIYISAERTWSLDRSDTKAIDKYVEEKTGRFQTGIYRKQQ